MVTVDGADRQDKKMHCRCIPVGRLIKYILKLRERPEDGEEIEVPREVATLNYVHDAVKHALAQLTVSDKDASTHN